MPNHVCNGTLLKCSFGVAPSPITVLPINRTTTSDQPAANLMDHIPMVNIMPFGMCMSPSNPEVIAATSAALGVFTPMPCIPATVAPWILGSPTVMLGNMPTVEVTDQLMCMWTGMITTAVPGQMTHMVP